MASPVYADLIRPSTVGRARVYDVALVAGFSLLIALGAQVAIPLPFTPVPVTLQTFAVLLAACLLGSVRGSLAVVLYLGEGFAGLPVFSGGTAGIAHLLGPTGGYLVGFVAAAYVAGLLAERGLVRKWAGALVTFLAGDALIFVAGASWLAAWVGADKAIPLGVLPFAIGEALKIAAGWGILTGAAIVVARRGSVRNRA
ncbi:MAG TPA: biotin transporter BioY [Spirochaetia bacterium]